MIGERLKKYDREPVWRKLEERLGDKPRNLRNRPGSKLEKNFVEFEHRNVGGGKLLGTTGAVVAEILDSFVGLPLSADTEISSVDAADNGTIYTINVNAPTSNIAEARAFIESGSGFTALLTDKLGVDNVEILKSRIARDTYQVEILVQD